MYSGLFIWNGSGGVEDEKCIEGLICMDCCICRYKNNEKATARG